LGLSAPERGPPGRSAQGHGRAAQPDVDRFAVLLELRNGEYNALMRKHTGAQEAHRGTLRELRVRRAYARALLGGGPATTRALSP
jgi:hypothetical protein